MNAAETRRALGELVSGEVLWDRDVLRFYSVDASAYQVVPGVVVVPRDAADVAGVVGFAARFGKPVTARGAGTGLVGNSLNSGIILDTKRLDSVRVGRGFAVVGPGVSKGRLDEELGRHGAFFPPNPSIGRYCSVGGMLGNNSSGSRSLKYGSTVDNVLEVTFVDGMGRVVTLPGDRRVGGRILELAGGLDRSRIPSVTKNSSGYRIDRVGSITETHRALVGSEGTLGVVVSAKIRTLPVPERRALYVIEYGTPREAAEDCPGILGTGPSAVEFVGSWALEGFERGLSRGAGCLLFVEYDSDLAGAGARIRRASAGSIRETARSGSAIRRWWRIRDMSLHYSLKSLKLEERVPHVIEDAAVPVENLAGLFDAIDDLNGRFGTDAVTYGHAGDGNIHVRLLAGRQGPEDIREMARYYFGRVAELGGSHSGEHGDGLARTEFVRGQYGPENYEVFRRLKGLLDPRNILNPGKIISRGSTVTRNLGWRGRGDAA